MKTVILAAGMGLRLTPLTHDRPKTMLEINQKMLIHYIISALLKNNVTDIAVVVGYQYKKIVEYLVNSFPEANFSFIVNTAYQSKENIYSLYLALRYIHNEDLLVINSDIFCDPQIFKKAIDARHNAMIIDTESTYNLESTKVKINESGYISDIGKDLSFDESDGEYIGILKLVNDSANAYFKRINEMIEKGDVHVWYPYALKKILPELKMKPILTNKLLWEEIDTLKDYASAIRKAKLMDNQRPV